MLASSPTESSATRGLRDPEHRLAEGGPEVGELHQVKGPGVGVRPHVEQQRRRPGPARDEQLEGERGPAHAVQIRRSANRAAVIVAPVDPALAIAWERPSATSRAARTTEARGLERTAATGSSALVISSTAGTSSAPSIPSMAARVAGIAEHTQPDPIGGSGSGAGDDCLGPSLGAATVEGDRRQPSYSSASAVSVGAASAISCSITSRPA